MDIGTFSILKLSIINEKRLKYIYFWSLIFVWSFNLIRYVLKVHYFSTFSLTPLVSLNGCHKNGILKTLYQLIMKSL